MFKLWSENNKQARDFLRPDLGLRNWNDLTAEEKNKIWHYLDWYFFGAQIKEHYGMMGDVEKEFYEFYGDHEEKECKRNTINMTIIYINENSKAKSFAGTYLKNPNLNTACHDFYNIFIEQEEFVVIELLSIYAKTFYKLTKNSGYIFKSEKETRKNFLQRKTEAEFKSFDDFSKIINDVFLQFGVKYYLTRDGFIPRQDTKIIKEVYEPVLSYLSDKKWEKVNEILYDAFSDYRKNTPQGYSSCITHTVSTLQAFLQILVNGKIGSSEGINNFIKQAQKRELIPMDKFSSEIFKNIESVLMRERGKTGDAHPKKEYANEKNARTMLNLVMIFFQHCIQK
ncbi:MAG: hypothetical protein KAQ87_01325 [Candidatus Pacebacteria bacterium]|nr:hypothetical protein [Candidatus Paceibacterota bacterium]